MHQELPKGATIYYYYLIYKTISKLSIKISHIRYILYYIYYFLDLDI